MSDKTPILGLTFKGLTAQPNHVAWPILEKVKGHATETLPETVATKLREAVSAERAGRALGEVTLGELARFGLEGRPHGLYVLRATVRDATHTYVGKCASRTIVDRIGAHLDVREGGFLNSAVRHFAALGTTTNAVALEALLATGRLLYVPVGDVSPQKDDAAREAERSALGQYETLLQGALGHRKPGRGRTKKAR